MQINSSIKVNRSFRLLRFCMDNHIFNWSFGVLSLLSMGIQLVVTLILNDGTSR